MCTDVISQKALQLSNKLPKISQLKYEAAYAQRQISVWQEDGSRKVYPVTSDNQVQMSFCTNSGSVSRFLACKTRNVFAF